MKKLMTIDIVNLDGRVDNPGTSKGISTIDANGGVDNISIDISTGTGIVRRSRQVKNRNKVTDRKRRQQ